MNFLEDIIYVNKGALGKAVKSFSKNWMLAFTGIVYTLLNLLALNLLSVFFGGPLSILSGIAFALLRSVLASNYLYLLFNIVNYNRLTIDNFKYGFTYYLREIYGVYFVLYIVRLLLSLLTPALGGLGALGGQLLLIINLLAMFILTALPETIYLKEYDAWESIVYSVNFLKENFINWIIPNLVFYLAIYFTAGEILQEIFNININFNFIFISNPIYIVRYIIGQVIFTFVMIYRGHLYKALSTSTRRKRTFMKKI